MNTRLLLIDDNILFRKGLAALLALQDDLLVVGELGSGREIGVASFNAEAHVVVLDVRLTNSRGLDVVAQIKRRQSQVRILVLTSARTEDFVGAALRLGVDGYVLKDATLEELLMAIRSVAKGKKYLSPDISCHVLDSFLHPEQAADKSSQSVVLTARERAILQLIAEGRTNRSAAEFLSVSPKTVEKHRASLMQKLGLKNATEMTLAAMEMGLIERPASFYRMQGIEQLSNDAP